MASVPAPHRHPRTLYDALAALPEGVTGEIIDEPEVHFVRDVEVATFDGTSPIRVAPFEDVEISPPWE